jgi:hypothetical protein
LLVCSLEKALMARATFFFSSNRFNDKSVGWSLLVRAAMRQNIRFDQVDAFALGALGLIALDVDPGVNDLGMTFG